MKQWAAAVILAASLATVVFAAGKGPEIVVASAAPTSAAAVAGTPSSAAAATAPAAPGAAAAKPVSESEALYQQGLAMESSGNASQAVRVYRRAARAGHGLAAKRLGEIFDKGVPGVGRDYAESLQWYETARQLGVEVQAAGKR